MVTSRRQPPVWLRAQRPDLWRDEIEPSDTLLVTFGFRCNFACVFCMVEDVLDRYRGCDLATMERYLADDAAEGLERVTLSGGEATLEPELLEYVRAARRSPRIRHVRVQTNASRLASRGYLQRLVDAGVDEFFVSIHGPDAETCDAITQRRGSFAAILAGLQAVADSDARLITNSAVCRLNQHRLRDLVDVVRPFRPSTIELWNLWPRVDEHDRRELTAPLQEVVPELKRALDESEAAGIPAVVKWFPLCLLGDHARFLDNSQPIVLVEAEYWAKSPAFGCLYQASCEHFGAGCSGLTHTYVERYGWEEGHVRPTIRTNTSTLKAADAAGSSATDVDAPEPPPSGPDLAGTLRGLGLEPGASLAGWTVGEGRRNGRGLRVRLASQGRDVTVDLDPHDAGRPCFARTKSFNISHRPVPAEWNVTPLLRAVVEIVTARDRGGLRPPGEPPALAEAETAVVRPGRRPWAERLRRYLLSTTDIDSESPEAAFLEHALRCTGDGRLPPGPPAFDLECSLRFAEAPERSRYNLTFLPATLGPQPWRAVRHLAEPLSPPPELSRWVDALESADQPPGIVHLGVARDGDVRTARFYLEQRSLDRVVLGRGSPSLAALSLEWEPAGRAHVVRRYEELPAGRSIDTLIRERFSPDEVSLCTPQLLDLLRRCRVRTAYGRIDDGDPGGARAFQLLLDPVPIPAVAAPLRHAARAAGCPQGLVDAWLADAEGGLMSVIGLGLTRSGRSHLTVYHRAPRGVPS